MEYNNVSVDTKKGLLNLINFSLTHNHCIVGMDTACFCDNFRLISEHILV